MDGFMAVLMYGWMDCDGFMEGLMDGFMVGWIYGWIYG